MADEILEGALSDYFSRDIGGFFDNKAIIKKKSSLALTMDFNRIDETLFFILKFNDELSPGEQFFLAGRLIESYLKQKFSFRHETGDNFKYFKVNKDSLEFNAAFECDFHLKIMNTCRLFEDPEKIIDFAIKTALNDPFNLFDFAENLINAKQILKKNNAKDKRDRKKNRQMQDMTSRAKEVYSLYVKKHVEKGIAKNQSAQGHIKN